MVSYSITIEEPSMTALQEQDWFLIIDALSRMNTLRGHGSRHTPAEEVIEKISADQGITIDEYPMLSGQSIQHGIKGTRHSSIVAPSRRIMASDASGPAEELESEFRERAGEAEDEVRVDINYNIIRQVSAQLYTNPRKAIEELVCNSYDAGASECYIRNPENTEDFLGVLDDGNSMDLEGIHWLWKVADSPKQKLGGDRIANNRQQIGKFGVGKLAAFALGRRLTHIATKDGSTRIISVSEHDIEMRPSTNPPKFEVYRLDTDEAEDVLDEYFDDSLPNPWDLEWDTWTLAIVDEIDEGKAGRELKPEYLDRMIRTALPISSNFKVARDGKPIDKRELDEGKMVAKLDISQDEDFRDKIERTVRQFWMNRLEVDDDDDVPENLYDVHFTETQNPENVDETVDALYIPELGSVFGYSFIYESTLTTNKRKERGYHDHGFHVKIKGRVLNKEDPLFGVSPRSHKYWNRFYAELEVPELDEAILVQRNQANEDKVQTQLTREVLRAIFNQMRALAEAKEEKERRDVYSPENFGKRLNTVSPYSAPLALEGLSEGQFPEQGVESIDVQFATYDEWDSLFDYEADSGTIYINDEHPIFTALDEVADSPSDKFKHVFAEALAGEFLGLGYLRYNRVDEQLLEEVYGILDDVLRTAVGYLRDEVEYLVTELEETSFEGNDPFEEAIVDAFRSVRLAARHQGGSGDHDGIITIPMAGEENFRLSLEAKGKKKGKKVSHADVKPSTVDQHRKERNCQHALVIAREFTEEGNSEERSQLLRQLDDWETISLLTTEAIEKILKLHSQRRFTHDQIIALFTNDVDPGQLVGFIEDTWSDSPDPGLTREILMLVWDDQQNDDLEKPDIGAVARALRRDGWEVRRQDVVHVLQAIQTMTGGMLRVDMDGVYVELKSDPDTILAELPREAVED